MANQVYQYELLIRESHLDFFGHVNNAVYLEILEEARWDFVTRNGYGLHKIKETGCGPIVLNVHLKFLKEITLRKNIIIFSQVLTHEKKIGTIKQWIEDEKKTLLLEASFTMGFFNMHERKLISPSPEWLKAIGVEKYQ